MAQPERWQLSGPGPVSYEQHLVPILFTPCATALVAQAALHAGERVLDAACGTGIEELFRDDKSGGFYLEASHLTDPKRLDTLLLALSVAVLMDL